MAHLQASRFLPALAALPLALAANGLAAESLEERVQRLEAALAQPSSDNSSATRYSFGGFIKVDAILSQYSGGERATAAVGDDFFVPSTIPVGGEQGDAQFDMQAKYSRIWFKTATQTEAGEISSHIEMDFGVNQIGDERISNSSAPRLRHAYVNWQYAKDSSFLAGQTWSTFFNVASLPETLDFVGPAATVFERQAQLRWTLGMGAKRSLMLALENPSTGLYGGDSGAPGDGDFDNNSLPDVVLRYNASAGALSYSFATVLREIAYQQDFSNGLGQSIEGDDSDIGYGLSLAAKWQLGRDDLKLQLNAGNLGRYLGLQSYRDGYIRANGDIELLDVYGGLIAYRHFWTPQWRSSLVLSASEADQPSNAPAGSPSAYRSAHANLLYSPVAALTLGAELIHGEKEVEGRVGGDDSGQLSRLQFSVKYVF